MGDLLSHFKIDLRVNNQISITRQRLAGRRSNRYEKIPMPLLSRESLNSLIETYANQEGLDTVKRWYDPKTHIVQKIGSMLSEGHRALLLDITHKFQRDNIGDRQNENKTTKRGYGATPTIKNFSAKAGQKLRESGAAIDILCNGEPEKCRVITLTLPSSGEDAYRAISDWSGYATNRLLQLIRRKKDDNFYWFYCVEHQKRGALHWHICLYHANPEQSREVGNELVSQWPNILRDIGGRCGVDLLFSKGFGRVVKASEMQSINQEMRKGCGAYFSKYAAKTSHGREHREVEDINTINARLYPPSSFWGRSHNLARLCRENSLSYKYEGLDGSDSESLRDEAFEILSQFDIKLTHSFSFKKEIAYKGNGRLTIAEGNTEVFYVSPSDYQVLLAHFRFLYSERLTSAIDERAKRRGGSRLVLEEGEF